MKKTNPLPRGKQEFHVSKAKENSKDFIEIRSTDQKKIIYRFLLQGENHVND